MLYNEELPPDQTIRYRNRISLMMS